MVMATFGGVTCALFPTPCSLLPKAPYLVLHLHIANGQKGVRVRQNFRGIGNIAPSSYTRRS